MRQKSMDILASYFLIGKKDLTKSQIQGSPYDS
jgi:hypothetical protein